MGHFKGSINLMQLLGTSVVSMEVSGKTMNCIVIPADYNDISVTVDKTTNQPNGAYLNFRLWETNAKFRQSCVERNSDKEGYIAPSHHFSNSYRELFQKNAEASAERRLRADEEFMKKERTDEQIKNEAKYAVNNKAQIGTVTPLERQQPIAFTGQAAPATASGAFVAPTVDKDGNTLPPEDLPF